MKKYFFRILGSLLAGLGIYFFYEFSEFVNDLAKRSSKRLYDAETEFISNNVYKNFLTELTTEFPNEVLLETLSIFPLNINKYDSICSKAIGKNGLSRILIAQRTDNEIEEEQVLEKLRNLYQTNVTLYATGEVDNSGFKWIQMYTYPKGVDTVGIIVNSDPIRSSIINGVYYQNKTVLTSNVTTVLGEKGLIISVPIHFDNSSRVRTTISQLFDFNSYFTPQFSVLNQRETKIQVKLQNSIIYEKKIKKGNLNKVFHYPDISLEIRFSEFDDSNAQNIFNFVFIPGIIGILLLASLFIFCNIARISAIKHSEYSTRFIANISHEIRTPLNGILGISEILSEKEGSNEDIKSITSCGNSLMYIINNVLENSSIKRGTFFLNILELNICKVLIDASDQAWRTYQKQDIKLIVSIGKGIPEYCVCDGFRVSHVFSNILSNAIKYTSSGEINVSIWGIDDVIHCETKDTGIGMDDKVVQSLFTSFDRSKSTGIGLSVSKKIAKFMDGDVYCVESKKNIGTTFMFKFKVKKSTEKTIQPNKIVLENITITRSKFDSKNENDKCVLIVDDISLNRNIMERIIESLGLTYDSCENGLEAVQFCKNKKYKTIFMDNMMPVMGGEEATRKIRNDVLSLNKDTPIIFVSANVQPLVIDRCLKCGGNGFLPKPITRNAIILALGDSPR